MTAAPPPQPTADATLEAYSLTLGINEEHRAQITSAGYISITDLEGVTVEELLADGIKRPVAKKLLGNLAEALANPVYNPSDAIVAVCKSAPSPSSPAVGSYPPAAQAGYPPAPGQESPYGKNAATAMAMGEKNDDQYNSSV